MVEKVLREAKKRLQEDPFDAGHDYEHHLAVAKNCLRIVEDERLNVDANALLIAAWWHDYKRNEDELNDQILRASMKNAGADDQYINFVLAIKNSHSFGNQQETTEQKVLFDADKLEYASVNRIKRVSQAVISGEMSRETQLKYKKAFEQRIGSVLQQLHFESSKAEMQKRIKEVRNYAQNDPLWSGIVDRV